MGSPKTENPRGGRVKISFFPKNVLAHVSQFLHKKSSNMLIPTFFSPKPKHGKHFLQTKIFKHVHTHLYSTEHISTLITKENHQICSLFTTSFFLIIFIIIFSIKCITVISFFKAVNAF